MRDLIPVFNGLIYKGILPDIRSLLPVPDFPNMLYPTQIVWPSQPVAYSSVSQPPLRGPIPEPWHQLYQAARGSYGICHFSFLSTFMNKYFVVEIF